MDGSSHNHTSGTIGDELIADQEDEGKLGLGFVSADDLEEIDIGDGDRPRPTFICKKLSKEFKDRLIEWLRSYKD